MRPEGGPDLEETCKFNRQFNRHVPFDPEEWAEAASLERAFRSKGPPLPRNDLLVATVAIRVGIPVICRDAHFEAIRPVLGNRLRVELV